MDDRATCWSITINNPTPDEMLCTTVGWTLKGQHEVGAEGTPHFQGMLLTPQVRFAAVKKAFPRAHIEVAKNQRALAKYVQKEETRVHVHTEQLNMFTAQTLIAKAWNWDQFAEYYENQGPRDEQALRYVDYLVEQRINEGVRALEFIAINPMWRSSWKRFWTSILFRNNNVTA